MMQRAILVALLLLLGVATWQVGTLLSHDAQGMAIGLVFGALAGMPAALLVLVAGRMSEQPEADKPEPWQPETEDDAPWAEWPEPANYPGPMSVIMTRFDDDDEEWLDNDELPSSVLWRMKELQADAIRRGWPHEDIDRWLAANADRIEAECRAKYAAMGVYP